MTDEQLQQLKDLQKQFFEESGPAAFFWAVSRTVEECHTDVLHHQVKVYNRLAYAGQFFRNRAKQIRDAALNKKTENGR